MKVNIPNGSGTHVVLSIGTAGTKVIICDDNTEQEIYSFHFQPVDIVVEVCPKSMPSTKDNHAYLTLKHLLDTGGWRT